MKEKQFTAQVKQSVKIGSLQKRLKACKKAEEALKKVSAGKDIEELQTTIRGAEECGADADILALASVWVFESSQVVFRLPGPARCSSIAALRTNIPYWCAESTDEYLKCGASA